MVAIVQHACSAHAGMIMGFSHILLCFLIKSVNDVEGVMLRKANEQTALYMVHFMLSFW